MGTNASKRLIIAKNGEESYLYESDVTGDVTFTSVEEMVESRTKDLLEQRDDWTIATPHVQKYREEWKNFYSKFQPGDRLVTFCTDQESWRAMAGRAGFLILRNNQIVAHEVTRLN